jgi:hypothetical protein
LEKSRSTKKYITTQRKTTTLISKQFCGDINIHAEGKKVYRDITRALNQTNMKWFEN